MSALADMADSTDLPALRAALRADDPQGRLEPLELDRIVIDGDVIAGLADTVAREQARAGRKGGVVVLVDATPIDRAGDDLKALVHECSRPASRCGRRCCGVRTPRCTSTTRRWTPRPPPSPTPPASSPSAAARSPTSPRSRRPAPPATCRSWSCRPPRRSTATPTTCRWSCAAGSSGPSRRAGPRRASPTSPRSRRRPNGSPPPAIGEVLSMFFAPADWYLASRLRARRHVPPGARRPARRGRPRPAAVVGRRRPARPAAVEQLVRMLAVRGVARRHRRHHRVPVRRRARGQPHARHAPRRARPAHRPARRPGRRRRRWSPAAAWEHLLAVFDPADGRPRRALPRPGDPPRHRARRLRRPRPERRAAARSAGATTRPS